MTTVLDRRVKSGGGSGPRPGTVPRMATVTVNGVSIPRGDIARETQNHPAEKPIEAWTAAARALVIRELLLQEARRLEVAPSPISDEEGRRETDEEALIRQLIDREVSTPEADEATCRRYYERNPSRFRSSDLCEARHILIAAPPADEAARSRAREEAAAILAEVRALPESFERLASARSACPSRLQGGHLGQIGRGQTVPEFEAAIEQLDGPGIVETRYGLHVVIVDRRIPGREVPFDIVKDRIAGWLASRSKETAIRQYIAMLVEQATISGIDLGGSPAPLVQ